MFNDDNNWVKSDSKTVDSDPESNKRTVPLLGLWKISGEY